MRTNLKDKREYKIFKRNSLDELYWDNIRGYQVVIAGFEEFQFIVNKERDIWHISELSTGFALPQEYDGQTRSEAIEKATAFLRERGKEKLLKAIERAKKIISGELAPQEGR